MFKNVVVRLPKNWLEKDSFQGSISLSECTIHGALFGWMRWRLVSAQVVSCCIYEMPKRDRPPEHICSTMGQVTSLHLHLSLKAHSYLPQRSADSAVDCVNAEIGIFQSLCVNATVCRTPQRQMQLVWMSLRALCINKKSDVPWRSYLKSSSSASSSLKLVTP